MLCRQRWTQAPSLHQAHSLGGWSTIIHLKCPKKEMIKMQGWGKLRATGQWTVQELSEKTSLKLRWQWEGSNMSWWVGEGFLAEEESVHRSQDKQELGNQTRSFKFCFCHVFPVWHRASYSTSLGLSVFMFKNKNGTWLEAQTDIFPKKTYRWPRDPWKICSLSLIQKFKLKLQWGITSHRSE